MEALKWIIQISFMVALVFLGVQSNKDDDNQAKNMTPQSHSIFFAIS